MLKQAKGKQLNMSLMTNLKPKYYTPSIEEFYVGFEYEFSWKDDNNWIKAAIEDGSQIDDIHEGSYDLRVKHLDREDIEGLGFHKTGEDVNELTFQSHIDERSWWELTWDWDEDKPQKWNVIIEYWYETLNHRSDCFTRFCGTIRNKSGLKTILKQVGYGQAS